MHTVCPASPPLLEGAAGLVKTLVPLEVVVAEASRLEVQLLVWQAEPAAHVVLVLLAVLGGQQISENFAAKSPSLLLVRQRGQGSEQAVLRWAWRPCLPQVFLLDF